ncbi:MAG: hypothetical protein ACP5KX_07355 [Caldisericia bacterium]
MSISSLIREEVKRLSYEGKDINVRGISRKFNCSPSLVVKNIYKVEKDENFKHISKFGVKGKVNLLIIDFSKECSPQISPQVTPECSPQISPQVTPECSPQISPQVTPECSPQISPQVTPECSPQISPQVTPECSPKENIDLETSLFQNNECSPLKFKKEKEKVSYNLLKEKENNEKFINKFLSILEIDNFSFLNNYEKNILKTYIRLGGKITYDEINFSKGILTFMTPKQFEAILLKIIREKNGEIPKISYLYEVSRRMNLKRREKKEKVKLFEKRNNGMIENTEKFTAIFSYRGFTGDMADRMFFGDD